mmetsp:Transcript_2023/g.2192  ORF Transcript_2023/g.2192 Transcript_2023/m.2192 type:complete len:209 (-) Transcript_2023:327-953(-)
MYHGTWKHKTYPFVSIILLCRRLINFYLIYRSSSETNIRRPKEADKMPKRHTDMKGQNKLHTITRSPQLDHSRQIILHIGIIFGQPILRPINRIETVPHHQLLNRIISRKVHQRHMNTNIKHHHLRRIDQPRFIFQLIRKRKLRKPIHRREPLTILVDEEEVLESSEVGESKYDEDAVATPVDVLPFFLFGDDLYHYVSDGCFCGGDH